MRVNGLVNCSNQPTEVPAARGLSYHCDSLRSRLLEYKERQV